MHIVVIADGPDRIKYYLTKYSRGDRNTYAGYIYLSEYYIRLKGVSILVHKDKVGLK
jgi:hypothetical protein